MHDEEAEAAFRRAIERDPGCNSTRLAKQHGLSGRAARRILRELAGNGAGRWHRGRVFAGGAALLAVGCSVWAWSSWSTSAEQAPVRPSRDTAAVALERDLYQALDARDPARVADAAQQLSSPDDSLRLAALRYLVANEGISEHQDAMLALVDDPSDRVRPAAIQLLAGVAGAGVDDRLLDVLLAGARPQAERLLACASLERRTVADRPAAARRAVDALLDPSAAIREVTQRLLRGLTGKTVTVGSADTTAIHAAWQQALTS